MGLSSRSAHWLFQNGEVKTIETVFITSLECWRQEQGIEKFHLGGHSLGAYLGARYAMKFPDRVQHLYLISPLGVLTPKQHTQPSAFFKLAAFFWNLRTTPNIIFRLLGPFGKRITAYNVKQQFSLNTIKHVDLVAEHHYNVNATPVSGEIGLLLMFTPGAQAISPLIKDLGLIKCSTTWSYGDDDWMDVEAGKHACVILNDQKSFQVVCISFPMQGITFYAE
jgi:pimeloyl-ACP methyl ester carboxylesterase